MEHMIYFVILAVCLAFENEHVKYKQNQQRCKMALGEQTNRIFKIFWGRKEAGFFLRMCAKSQENETINKKKYMLLTFTFPN